MERAGLGRDSRTLGGLGRLGEGVVSGVASALGNRGNSTKAARRDPGGRVKLIVRQCDENAGLSSEGAM